MHTIILGAGISGLVAGYTLSQKENNLIILAKDSDYGGLGGYFTIEGFRFDRFVHFSFTKDDKVDPIFVNSSWGYRICEEKHLVKYLRDKHKFYILVRPNSDFPSLCVKHTFPLWVIYYSAGLRLSNWSENILDLLKIFESKMLGLNICIVI